MRGANRRPVRTRHGRFAPVLLVLLLLGACARDPDAGYVALPDAVMRPHPVAVPHTDTKGAPRTGFDPAASFLPLALGAALADYGRGGRGFAAAFDAHFNAVAPDPEQPDETLRRAADDSRVVLLSSGPGPGPDAGRLDASRVVIVTMPRAPEQADSFAATAADHRDRPVWALLPVWANLVQGESLVTPQAARALAIAAFTAGASGLIWLGEDSYRSRAADHLGIAPAPRIDYGITIAGTERPLSATPAEVAAARGLWDTVAALNRRLARLAPALLQPDADVGIRVLLRDDALRPPRLPGAPPPLRFLLRRFDGNLLLFAVNLSRQDHTIRLLVDGGLRLAQRFDAEAPVSLDAKRGALDDTLEPYSIRIWQLVR